MYVGSCEDRFSCEEIELVSREGTTVEAFENNFQQVLLIERYYRFDIEGRERERERERERLFHWTVVDINSGWRESGGVSVTSQSQLWRDANAVQAPPTSSIETVNILQYVRRWSFAKVNTSVSINVMGAHAHGSFEVESPWSKLRRSLPASKVRQHVHNDKQRERERERRESKKEKRMGSALLASGNSECGHGIAGPEFEWKLNLIRSWKAKQWPACSTVAVAQGSKVRPLSIPNYRIFKRSRERVVPIYREKPVPVSRNLADSHFDSPHSPRTPKLYGRVSVIVGRRLVERFVPIDSLADLIARCVLRTCMIHACILCVQCITLTIGG